MDISDRKMEKLSPYSIVVYYGLHGHECGYCGSPETHINYGMWAHTLTVHDYQALIDRGWRRSGCYCYKPVMNKTCCPMYTIKCEALKFQASRSQRKIINKVAKYMKCGYENKNGKPGNIRNDDSKNDEFVDATCAVACSQRELKMGEQREILIPRCRPYSEMQDEDSESKEKSVQSMPSKMNTPQAATSTSNPAQCRKAKFLRMERSRAKLLAQGKTQEEIKTIFNERKKKTEKKVADKIKSWEIMFRELGVANNQLKRKLVRVRSVEFVKTLKLTSDLYAKYQMAIHGERPDRCNRTSFINFLCNSPLQPWTPDKGPKHGYGSFHEQYWLNGEVLIAVAVIDILPSCVSSVYFFYDPAYSDFSLGTFSSLCEVYMTRKLNKIDPSLKYYYMGFYIHNCPKMRYKAKMKPSKLLCPDTNQWFDIELCITKLDKQKYSRLNDDDSAVDEGGATSVDEVSVLYEDTIIPYKSYRERGILAKKHTAAEEKEVQEYAGLVGRICTQTLLLDRPRFSKPQTSLG